MLNKELSQLRNIVSLLPGNVYLKDTNGIYIDCNQAQASTCNFPYQQDMIGKSDYDLLCPEEAKIIVANDRHVLETKKLLTVEECVTLKYNKKQYFLSKKKPLFDENNNVIGILGISIDITDEKEKELALLEEKENTEITLQKVISMMPGHVYWLNNNLIYLGCNEQQAKAAELSSPNDIIGKYNSELIWRHEAEELDNINRMVIETKTQYTVEETNRNPGQEEKTFLSKKVPLLNKQNNVIGMLGVSFDITERKNIENELHHAKEQAEHASMAKSEFLANMSHDIRTPLAGMIGATETLLQKSQGSESIEIITDLHAASKQLLSFLNKILENIQYELDHIPSDIRSFSLQHMLDSIYEIFLPSIKQKPIEFIIRHDTKIPGTLDGKDELIYRILLNLISNAIKFTQHGKIEVSTKFIQEVENQVTIEFKIADTGVGIPENRYRDIFNMFTRLTPSYKGIYEGTGLGLYSVKLLLDALHGTMQLESTVDHGSTFTFSLTLEKAPESDLFSTSDIMNSSSKDLHDNIMLDNYMSRNTPRPKVVNNHKIKISPSVKTLLVEDVPLMQKIAAAKLEDIGCNVTVASNGEEALQKVKEKHYDLIYLDIGLPDMDGYTAATKIREWETSQRSKPTPIIALTAHIDKSGEEKSLKAGINHILIKPLLEEKAKLMLDKFI